MDVFHNLGQEHNLSSMFQPTLRKEGVGKININLTLLLTKCVKHNPVITNNCFIRETGMKSPGNIHTPSAGTWMTTSMFDIVINKIYSKQEPSLVPVSAGLTIITSNWLWKWRSSPKQNPLPAQDEQSGFKTGLLSHEYCCQVIGKVSQRINRQPWGSFSEDMRSPGHWSTCFPIFWGCMGHGCVFGPSLWWSCPQECVHPYWSVLPRHEIPQTS